MLLVFNDYIVICLNSTSWKEFITTRRWSTISLDQYPKITNFLQKITLVYVNTCQAAAPLGCCTCHFYWPPRTNQVLQALLQEQNLIKYPGVSRCQGPITVRSVYRLLMLPIGGQGDRFTITCTSKNPARSWWLVCRELAERGWQ